MQIIRSWPAATGVYCLENSAIRKLFTIIIITLNAGVLQVIYSPFKSAVAEQSNLIQVLRVLSST